MAKANTDFAAASTLSKMETNSSTSTSLKGLATSTISAPEAQAFRFLDLPTELRVEIYEYVVVVGKIFYAPDWYDKREGPVRFHDCDKYAVPSLQLLRVCKQVQYEAENVYAAKNLFVLPYQFADAEPFMFSPVRGVRPLFSEAVVKKIKNLSTSFSSRERFPLTMSGASWGFREKYARGTYESFSPMERMQQAHDEALANRDEWWRELNGFLGYMEIKLDMFEMDLTNAFCPVGCCRELNMELSCIAALEPKVIRILGLRHGEGDKIKSTMAVSLGINVTEVEGKFEKMELNPAEDPWGKWRV
jgi:hypothetical protein